MAFKSMDNWGEITLISPIYNWDGYSLHGFSADVVSTTQMHDLGISTWTVDSQLFGLPKMTSAEVTLNGGLILGNFTKIPRNIQV